MAKLTKRQMKEDKFVTGLLKTQEYFNQYRNQILIVAAGVLVVVLVIVLLITNARSGEKVAENQYGNASMYIRDFYNTLEADRNQDGMPDGNLDTALATLTMAKENLEELINKHGGSDMAKFAVFNLATISFRLGDYQEAEKYYQKFINKYFITREFEAAAKMGLAGCIETRGDFGASGKLYLEIAQKYTDFPQYVDAVNKAAINLARANMKEEALKAFDLLEKSDAARSVITSTREILYENSILNPYSIDQE